MSKTNTKIHLFETYLAVIKNSVGSKMFRNFFMEIDGAKIDATRDGIVSCAFFVSNVVHMFPKLITQPHLTVASTVKDLKENGWAEISEPRLGAILIWEPKLIADSMNSHIGFYIGDDKAVSNFYETGTPVEHHWTYGTENGLPVRKVEMILWNAALEG
jgi:hypothetical protein